jgi:hypothetical protein
MLSNESYFLTHLFAFCCNLIFRTDTNGRVPFSPMVFIPFVGAVIAQKEPSRSAWEDAVIALAGPGLGTLGAAAVGVAGYATNTQVRW